MYYSTQALELRGWTKSLIKKFLPKPDYIQEFRYGCAYFYEQVTVDKIEKKQEFKELQQKALKRREAGIKSTEKRRKEYLEYLENMMPVRVRVIDDQEELIREACDSYNRHQRDLAWRAYERGYGDEFQRSEADPHSDKLFLQRITVNYIRHELTRYENFLRNTHGKLAKEEAIKIIQRRVFVAIAEHYPNFKEECKRQCAAKGIDFPEPVIYELGEQMSLFA